MGITVLAIILSSSYPIRKQWGYIAMASGFSRSIDNIRLFPIYIYTSLDVQEERESERDIRVMGLPFERFQKDLVLDLYILYRGNKLSCCGYSIMLLCREAFIYSTYSTLDHPRQAFFFASFWEKEEKMRDKLFFRLSLSPRQRLMSGKV